VIPVVAGSNPVGHPKFPCKWQQPPIDCAGKPGAACAALTSAALAQVAANLAGAIEGRNPEYLHQLRVGIRRLRTLLRILKAKRLDRKLRKLAAPLGEARDWDVFVARFGEAKQRQRAAHLRCRRVLQSAGFRALLVETQRWARSSSAIGEPPLTAFARKVLDRLHRKVRKRAHDVDWRDEKDRHAVRIAVRRLRYACDFFSPCFSDGRRYLRGLADLQDLLGELNDIAVARRFDAPKAALEKRERALISELVPAWRAFEERRRFWVDKGKPQAAAR
jgi:triphosphatase